MPRLRRFLHLLFATAEEIHGADAPNIDWSMV